MQIKVYVISAPRGNVVVEAVNVENALRLFRTSPIGETNEPERIVLLSTQPVVRGNVPTTWDQARQKAVEAAWEASGGNKKLTAEILQVGERTVYRWIDKYMLDEEQV